jgi:hypothetical protein
MSSVDKRMSSLFLAFEYSHIQNNYNVCVSVSENTHCSTEVRLLQTKQNLIFAHV